MKTILFFIGINILLISNVISCDMCGCYMGITPYDNQSSFGLYHRYRSFNGYGNANQSNRFFPKSALSTNTNTYPPAYPVLRHGDHGAPTRTYSEKDYEIYSLVELRGKYFIHQRIELNGILPYVTNSIRNNDTVTHLNAIGDINLYAGFHLIRPDINKKIQQRFILGTGVKLASGHYYIGHDEGERISILNQPGSGSNDFTTYLNYVLGIRNWGFNTTISMKFNGENYFNEKIANSMTNFTNVFYKFKKGNFIFIPSIQTYFESSAGLYINKILQSGTDVKLFMAGPGFDLYFKNFGLNSNFQFTVYEDYHDGNLLSGCKLLIGLSYNFNQKKYLLNKKD